MTAPTHITFAEFVYLLLLTTTGITLNIMNAGVIGVSSLLADLDTAASTVGKLLPFISTYIERKFGHRTFTHSVLFITVLTLISLPLEFLNSQIYACFIFGYASHPLLDTMTVNGVKLFYPFSSVKCVFPFEVNNPHRYRVQTGGKMDKTLSIIFLIGCVPTFFIAYQGYERFIRSAQQNIEAAVRDFNEYSKDHLVSANVTAYNMLTKEPLSGTVEIVGALDPRTLVFKGRDGILHTLGKEFQADYVAENVLCNCGELAHSIVQNIDLSNQLLSRIEDYIDISGENYFFGDLTTTDKVSLPENIRLFSSITGSTNTIKFNYATCGDIRDFNLGNIFISKGILTVKSILQGVLPDSRRGISTLPQPGRLTQFSATLTAKETIVFLKQKGDSVIEGELLARKNLAEFFQEKVELNDEKIQMLGNQKISALADIDQKISAAEQTVRIDSDDFQHTLELSRFGYTTTALLQQSKLKLQKDKRLLSQLIEGRRSLIDKTSHEIRKLKVENVQLLAKRRSAEFQSEIRSTVKGVILDIRQIQRNDKIQVTFIIRGHNNHMVSRNEP